MNVYAFQAALLCEKCGENIKGKLAVFMTDDGDSDRFPQGPYSDGGGEADSPQHCDDCGTFLENPLTADGESYLRERVEEHNDTGCGDPAVIAQWVRFYDHLFDDLPLT